jgi:hypothetical protein
LQAAYRPVQSGGGAFQFIGGIFYQLPIVFFVAGAIPQTPNKLT